MKNCRQSTIGVIFFILLILHTTSKPSYSKVYIDITSPNARRIPIAIPEFKYTGEGNDNPAVALTLYKTLIGDMEFTGLFDIIDKEGYIEDPKRAGLTARETDFQDWRVINAELLIKGGYRFTENGRGVVVELRLFDVLKERMITGQRYYGSIKGLRKIIHRFSNRVMKALTGEEGIFETKLAFVSTRTGNKEIYICDYDGYNLRQITMNGAINISPQWSPNGKWLLFTSFKDGEPFLYRKNVFNGVEHKISRFPGINIGGRWSPSGREIAFTLSKDGNPELYLLDLWSGRLKRLTQNWGIDVSPTWSPDGKKIAFVSDISGKPNIYVMRRDGTNVKRLTYKGKYNTSPAWSPKGDRIAFSRLEGRHFDIWTMRPDGTDQKRLTFDAGDNEHPTWSPDGRYIAFTSSRDGYKAIYIMRADGSRQMRIVKGLDPSWSPQFR